MVASYHTMVYVCVCVCVCMCVNVYVLCCAVYVLCVRACVFKIENLRACGTILSHHGAI